MKYRLLAVLSVLFLALSLGMLYAHVLEMLPKLDYSPVLYTRLNTSLYPLFGTVGATVEVCSLVASIVLAIVAYRRGQQFLPIGISAGIQLLVLVLWFGIVAPVNGVFAAARPNIPAGFEQLRLRWEAGHALDAGLLLVALIVLVSGLLRVQPRLRSTR
jgi:hypothetical protein